VPNLFLPPRPHLTLRITVPKGEISNSVTDGPKNDGRHASETGKSKGTHTLARISGTSLATTDFEQSEGAEYGDSSAAYWDLYASEAKISDQKFVDTLISDTEAMSIMVRGKKRASPSAST
jgi:hypothetical protein